MEKDSFNQILFSLNTNLNYRRISDDRKTISKRKDQNISIIYKNEIDKNFDLKNLC